MIVTTNPFTQIDRQYIIKSKELRKALKLEGEILFINLWKGRSPNDIREEKSAENDEWEIKTVEIQDKR